MGLFSWFADLAIKGKVSISGETTIGDNLRVTSANGRFVGIDGLQDGHEVDFRFGDAYNRIGTKYGDRVFISSYHGVKLGNYGGGSYAGLTVVNAQANTNIAEFFGSDNGRKFAITQAGALLFPDGTSMATAASGGGGTDSSLGTLVTTKTRRGIQAAIWAASSGDTLRLSGRYVNDGWADPIECNKSVRIIAPSGAIIDGGTEQGFLMKVNTCDRFVIENVVFTSQFTGSDYALLFFNQSGSISNATVRRCGFSCPKATMNAIGVCAFADNDTTSNVNVLHDGILFEECWGDGIGRMFLEVVNHAWNNSIRIKGVKVHNCIVRDTGLVQPENGMVISYSGENDGLVIDGLYATNFSGVGIEHIGTRRSRIDNVTLITTRNWYGNPTGGISYTDGGNEEGDASQNRPPNPGHYPRQNVIGSAVIVDVPGVPLKFYYGGRTTINGGHYKGSFVSLQHSQHVTMNGTTIEGNDNSVIEFDCSANNKLIGCRLLSVATGTTYQKVLFFNSNSNLPVQSVNNNLIGCFLEGPDAGNGLQINQSLCSGNKWQTSWLNNTPIPDQISGNGKVNNQAQLV